MGVDNNNFRKDLDFGKYYEDQFIKEYTEEFDEAIPAPNKSFPDWDWNVRRGNTWTKYEVKSDKRACDTGNIFVEYRHTNKPSGISISKSDLYVFFIINKNQLIDVFEVETKILKEMCDSGKYQTRVCYNDGFNKSEGYVIPLKEFS